MRDKLDQLIDDLLVDLADLKDKSDRQPEFRVSSFPYCPLRTLLFKGEGNESFSSNFYTSIGTAVHETLQKWITKGSFREKVYSCWKIVETGEIIGPCLYRDIPKKYNNCSIQYEEITIGYRGLSGHVDLVVELLPGRFIVIDFKTTNLGDKKRRMPGEWQKKYPASRNSIIQISTYSTLLRKLFKINVVAWCLVYIDRGDPIRTKQSYHKVLRPWNKRKHKKFMEHIEQACDNNKSLTKLNWLLEQSDEEFNPKARKLLVKLVQNRPCIDDDTYDEWMDYKFHKGWTREESPGVKKGECIMKAKCLKGNKACFKAVVSRL